MQHTARPLIAMRKVSKQYNARAGGAFALREVSLDIAAGEFVAIIGKSGSGKTTLINLLTGIDSATSGTVEVAGTAVHALDQEQLARWRGKYVGIVFQFFQLLPTLTIAENIVLPMDFCNAFPSRERHARAMHLLAELGVADQANQLPCTLSGGQQQRAAIARALANDPQLVVADEPTGNLDSRTAQDIMELFARLTCQGKTVVIVTHERDLDRYSARSVTLADGQLA